MSEVLKTKLDPAAPPPPPESFNAIVARFMNREVFGMPVALIACVIAAALFGGLIAMTAGSN